MNITARLQLIACLFIAIQVALARVQPLFRAPIRDDFDEDRARLLNPITDPESFDADGDFDFKINSINHHIAKKAAFALQSQSLPEEVSSLKRSSNRLVKKIKPITFNGYSMDINIESFKTNRLCGYDEVCKQPHRPIFECVCPRRTLCSGQGSQFDAKCSQNLSPYVWIQHADDGFIFRTLQ